MAINTVAVIGAGTMGAGIAQVCAQCGWATKLFDAFPEGLSAGMENINAFWDKGIAKGKTTEEQKAEWSANLEAIADMATAVADADLVIEAVPEIADLKHRIFSDLARMAPDHAVLASNTSSLSIAEIAAATDCGERVIGMHFFNPVPLMKLLELVYHEKTSEATIAIAKVAAAAMGKTDILVKDIPGFATSRLGVVSAMKRFACSLKGLPALGISIPLCNWVIVTRWGRWRSRIWSAWMYVETSYSIWRIHSPMSHTSPIPCWKPWSARVVSVKKAVKESMTGRQERRKSVMTCRCESRFKGIRFHRIPGIPFLVGMHPRYNHSSDT